MAVDSGPAVVNRSAARSCGRTAAQRNAIVIDRFFESREAALNWESSHPHFMTVHVVQPGSHPEFETEKRDVSPNETPTAALPETKNLQPRVNADGMELVSPTDPSVHPARRRTS